MSYDAAANLKYDNYPGRGERVFDAENCLTRAYVVPASNDVVQGWYIYGGDGRRISRQVSGVAYWATVSAGQSASGLRHGRGARAGGSVGTPPRPECCKKNWRRS